MLEDDDMVGAMVSLNGTWDFRLDPDDVGQDEGWFQPGVAGDWATIQVPAMWQVAGYSGYNGWAWYRLRFQGRGKEEELPLVSPLRSLLRFHGVSYWAKVWLNGQYLGAHEGHFAPFEFDVTDVLRDENTLVVRCGCPLEEWQKTVQFCEGKDKRTTLGALQDWDCIPYPTRTNPSGIWRDVMLETTGPAFIRHADLATLDHDHKGEPGYDGLATAQVELRLTLVNLGARTQEAQVRLAFTPRDREGPAQTVELRPLDLMRHTDWPLYKRRAPTCLDDLEQEHMLRFEVPEVHLWWPWDLGTQNLYDVAVELWLGDELSYRLITPFGFRTVQKGLNDPAVDRWNWALFVNGVRFFARGSNYLGDQFPSRMTRQRYQTDVQLAKEANMNMLRVFATVERPEFYDVCDEWGLLVYQDYPLQWSGYVHTDEFSRACQRQAAELVHLVHNHPAVFMYAGHSEPWDVDVQREIDKPMAAVVRALDPTRPAIFENGTGPEHDLHAWSCGWYGGHIEDIDAWCDEARAGFVGEFGAQSFPGLEHLRQYPTLTEDDLKTPINVAKLELLNFQPQIFERYLRLERRRDPIEAWIERSQVYQAELLKAHIEAFRRHKYADINGALTFHFVDNYPGLNWAILDFWRTPKPAYYAVQRAFRPIHVMASSAGSPMSEVGRRFVREVWVVNDSQQAYPGCQVWWRLTDPLGGEVDVGRIEVDIQPDDLICLGQVSCPLPKEFVLGRYVFALELREAAGVLLSDNEYAIEIGMITT
jgi:beta-mannosidase